MKLLTAIFFISMIPISSQAEFETENSFLPGDAPAKKWTLYCDGISDRGLSNSRFSSLAACERAAKGACSTRDGRVIIDAYCSEVED